MKYKIIKFSNGTIVPTKTIKELKHLIRKKKISEGTFQCECPGGNIHTWKVTTSIFVAKGSGAKGKKIGAGVNLINTKATLENVTKWS